MQYNNQYEVVEALKELKMRFTFDMDLLIRKGQFIDPDVEGAIGEFEERMHECFDDSVLFVAKEVDEACGATESWED